MDRRGKISFRDKDWTRGEDFASTSSNDRDEIVYIHVYVGKVDILQMNNWITEGEQRGKVKEVYSKRSFRSCHRDHVSTDNSSEIIFVSSVGIPPTTRSFHPGMKFYAIVNFWLRTKGGKHDYISISFIESVQIRKREKGECNEEDNILCTPSKHFLLK